MLASEVSEMVSDGRGPVIPAQRVHRLPVALRNESCNTAGLPDRAERLHAAEGYSSGPENLRLHAGAPQNQQKPERTKLHMESVQRSSRLCHSAAHADV